MRKSGKIQRILSKKIFGLPALTTNIVGYFISIFGQETLYVKKVALYFQSSVIFSKLLYTIIITLIFSTPLKARFDHPLSAQSKNFSSFHFIRVVSQITVFSNSRRISSRKKCLECYTWSKKHEALDTGGSSCPSFGYRTKNCFKFSSCFLYKLEWENEKWERESETRRKKMQKKKE